MHHVGGCRREGTVFSDRRFTVHLNSDFSNVRLLAVDNDARKFGGYRGMQNAYDNSDLASDTT